MKRLNCAVAVLAASTTLAQAGGPVVVAVEPTPVVSAQVALYDWSGPYVGIGYGRTSGDLSYNPGFAYSLNNGSAGSIFAGYLVQNGSLVYGGELAYSRGNDTYAEGYPLENVDQMIDLKGRLGYAANNALFYGVLGYSSIKYKEVLGGYRTNGINYGLGVDYAVSNRVTIGIEYLVRNTDGSSQNLGQTANLDVNTVTLRLGYSF